VRVRDLGAIRESSRYWLFATPFAGLIIVPFGANAFYSLFLMSYRTSACLSAIGCILLSVAVTFFYRARPSADFGGGRSLHLVCSVPL